MGFDIIGKAISGIKGVVGGGMKIAGGFATGNPLAVLSGAGDIFGGGGGEGGGGQGEEAQGANAPLKPPGGFEYDDYLKTELEDIKPMGMPGMYQEQPQMGIPGIPGYAQGGIPNNGDPALISDMGSGQPVGTMNEQGAEMIAPLTKTPNEQVMAPDPSQAYSLPQPSGDGLLGDAKPKTGLFGKETQPGEPTPNDVQQANTVMQQAQLIQEEAQDSPQLAPYTSQILGLTPDKLKNIDPEALQALGAQPGSKEPGGGAIRIEEVDKGQQTLYPEGVGIFRERRTGHPGEELRSEALGTKSDFGDAVRGLARGLGFYYDMRRSRVGLPKSALTSWLDWNEGRLDAKATKKESKRRFDIGAGQKGETLDIQKGRLKLSEDQLKLKRDLENNPDYMQKLVTTDAGQQLVFTNKKNPKDQRIINLGKKTPASSKGWGIKFGSSGAEVKRKELFLKVRKQAEKELDKKSLKDSEDPAIRDQIYSDVYQTALGDYMKYFESPEQAEEMAKEHLPSEYETGAKRSGFLWQEREPETEFKVAKKTERAKARAIELIDDITDKELRQEGLDRVKQGEEAIEVLADINKKLKKRK